LDEISEVDVDCRKKTSEIPSSQIAWRREAADVVDFGVANLSMQETEVTENGRLVEVGIAV
jgi:hypothetical protein